MQAEVILECWIDAGEHLDIRTRREELISGAGQHNHVDVIVHASLEDRVIELAIHLVGVRIRGRVEHLNNCYSAIRAVVDELLGGFCSRWLHCRGHENRSLVSKSTAKAAYSVCSHEGTSEAVPSKTAISLFVPWWSSHHARKCLPFRLRSMPRRHRRADCARYRSNSSCRTGSTLRDESRTAPHARASNRRAVPRRFCSIRV